MVGRKALVWIATALAMLAFAAMLVYEKPQNSQPAVLNTSKFVALGKPTARVEILLVEDLRCNKCRDFSETVIPKIHAKYILTGQARFILVPVAFLYGSKTIANAVLEVYHHTPSKFFSYLQEILIQAKEGGELNQKDLVRIARRIEGIDINRLQECLEKGCHNDEIEENYLWAQSVMGGQFKTPSLFINGKQVTTASFEEIEKHIGSL